MLLYYLSPDDQGEAISALLAWLGEDPNDHEEFVIGKAEPVLTPIRPYVQRFLDSARIEGRSP